MLQKNPALDADRVRTIIRETATGNEEVGAVPNPRWGYGKLNPEAAIARTRPLRRPTRRKR